MISKQHGKTMRSPWARRSLHRLQAVARSPGTPRSLPCSTLHTHGRNFRRADGRRLPRLRITNTRCQRRDRTHCGGSDSPARQRVASVEMDRCHPPRSHRPSRARAGRCSGVSPGAQVMPCSLRVTSISASSFQLLDQRHALVHSTLARFHNWPTTVSNSRQIRSVAPAIKLKSLPLGTSAPECHSPAPAQSAPDG